MYSHVRRSLAAVLLSLLPLACLGSGVSEVVSEGGGGSENVDGSDGAGNTAPGGGQPGNGANGDPSTDVNDTSALDNDPSLRNAAFSPLPLSAQLAKIKVMLHGDPVTEAELAQAKAQGLATVVAAWQKTPQYKAHILRFLSVALQQSQVTAENLTNREKGFQFTRGTAGSPPYKYMLQNIRESMARTVLELDAQGKPFDAAMTTHQFMMTAPLAAYYVIDDGMVVADDGKVTNTSIDESTRLGQNSLQFSLSYSNEAYQKWSLVTLRTPKAGEARSSFAAPNVATPTELVLQTPRQGFMTTPAFFGQWRSNIGNSSRVQINQAMIVGIGHQFDGSNFVQPLSTAAMDEAHVQPNTACYSCHVDMDPMRQLYRRYYTYFGDKQTDPTQLALPSQFVYGGVSKSTATADELGANLAAHPMMPLAWAQKVCAFANSAPCLEDDPELLRLATSFANNRSFSQLVLGVFTSPLTTYARATQTTVKNGVTFAVTKVDQLCPLLGQRLGINDVCGLDPQANPGGDMKVVQTITSIFPAHSFARGTVNTEQANDPTLFLRAGGENVCAKLAGQVVDINAAYPSGNPTLAVQNLVHQLMGVPAADDAEPIAILLEHQKQALGKGLSTGDAMRSTFIVACLSPSVLGVGQ